MTDQWELGPRDIPASLWLLFAIESLLGQSLLRFLGKVGMEQWVWREVSCSYRRMERQQLLRETEFVPKTGEVCLLRPKSRKLYNERSLVITSGLVRYQVIPLFLFLYLFFFLFFFYSDHANY